MTSQASAAAAWPLRGRLRARLQRWALARLPLSDRWTLTQRNVYIVPTAPGFMLGATLLVLLIASINYQLNLGYLLTFLLAGSAAVGLQLCHATLRGLTLHLEPPAPQFAGSSAELVITLDSARRSPRHAIGLAVHGSHQWSWADVPAQGRTVVHLGLATPTRGLHPVPALTAETRFPMGTFRAWTVWRPAAQLLVYPAPEPAAPPLPAGEPRGGEAAATASRQQAGEPDGVRAYQRGDPMRLLVWKKMAKSGELVSRDTVQTLPQALWLDFSRLGMADPEARLSRLCAWVLAADRAGLAYGLRLPGQLIAPGSGAAHRHACLEALARC